jgi:DNA gyrase subunit A
MKEFKFSDRQATAILEMKLQRLAGLERKKIEDELTAVQALIKELKEILANPKSHILRSQLELINRFEGFKSLCNTLALWRYLRPRNI